MRLKILIVMIISLVCGLFVAQEAFGQSTVICPSCIDIQEHELSLYKQLFPLIIWTENQVYDHKSIIHIHGFLRPENYVSPVTITVISPIGNIVAVEQLTPKKDGTFEFFLNTSGPGWKKDGQYIIKATSGSSSQQFKISVDVVSYELGTSTSCTKNEVKVLASLGGTYCIPFKVAKGQVTGIDGLLDIPSKALTVKLQGNAIENIVLNIPRTIIDSKSEYGSDSNFVVMSGGKIVKHEELDSNPKFRQIKLDFPQIQDGEFQIIGTTVVPEFGSIVMIVLVSAIAATMVLGRSFSHNLVKF